MATTVERQRAVAGAALGTALVVVRAAAKIVAGTLLARASGTTWKQGMLEAVAMSPLSTFVVLIVEDTRAIGIDLVDAMAPVAAATLLRQRFGPVATQVALKMAAEVPQQESPSNHQVTP